MNENGNEDIIGEGRRKAKKRKTTAQRLWTPYEKRERLGLGWVERGKNVEKKGLVQ